MSYTLPTHIEVWKLHAHWEESVYFMLVLGAARGSLPKVLLIKFCGGLFLWFRWHPTQIYSVCIGLIKMVHHRTYMKWISHGYGCSYHDTLCKFREIAAATHREALMVSTAILTSFQDVKKWLWTVLIAKICIRLKIRMRTSIFQNSNKNIARNLPWNFYSFLWASWNLFEASCKLPYLSYYVLTT